MRMTLAPNSPIRAHPKGPFITVPRSNKISYLDISVKDKNIRFTYMGMNEYLRFYEKKTSSLNEFKQLGTEVGQTLKTKSNNSYKR